MKRGRNNKALLSLLLLVEVTAPAVCLKTASGEPDELYADLSSLDGWGGDVYNAIESSSFLGYLSWLWQDGHPFLCNRSLRRKGQE